MDKTPGNGGPEGAPGKGGGRAEEKEFFRDMEANMRRNIQRGYLSADVYAEAKESSSSAGGGRGGAAADRAGLDFFLGSDEPRGVVGSGGGGGGGGGDKAEFPEPLDMSEGSPSRPAFPHRIVRTISTVDDMVLEEMKRTESFIRARRAVGTIRGSSSTSTTRLQGPRRRTFTTTVHAAALARRNSTSTIFVDSTRASPTRKPRLSASAR